MGLSASEYVAALPIVGCAAAFACLYLRIKPIQPSLLVLVVGALWVRWFFVAWFDEANGDLLYDATSYRIVGDLVRSGDDVYAATNRHPYLPFQMYFMGMASWLDAHTQFPFFTWVRWPNIIADLCITVLIFRSLQKLGRPESEAFWLTAIWVLHPISIYTSTIHGQFDSTAVLFALLSWYFVYFWGDWRGVFLGGVAMGFAILDKTWPFMWLIPLMLAAPIVRQRLVFVALAAAVPLFALGVYGIVFGTTLDLIVERVIAYDAVPNRYGFTYAFGHYLKGDVPSSWLPFFQNHGRQIFALAIISVTVLVVPRRDAVTSCVAIFATFLVFAHGWGSQYLVWGLPFALIARRRAMLALYSVVATAAVVVYYWGTCGYECPGWFSSSTFEYWQFAWVWPVAMLWLAAELWGVFHEGRAQGSLIPVEIRQVARGWWRTDRRDSDLPRDS